MPDRDLRIVLVTDTFAPQTGGGVRYAYEVGRRFAKRGHQVWVVTPRWSCSWPLEEGMDGMTVVRHEVSRSSIIAAYHARSVNARRAVEAIADGFGIDVVDCFQFASAQGAIASAVSRRIGIVWTFLGPADEEMLIDLRRRPLAGWKRLVRPLYRRLIVPLEARYAAHAQGRQLLQSDAVISLSRYTVGHLQRLAPDLPPVRVHVVPGGVDADTFLPLEASRGTLDTAHGNVTGSPLLFTLRRLVPRMGLENLVSAMETLVQRLPKARLVIGGEGPLRPSLERQVRAAGLQDHVRFTGRIEDAALPAYYQAAHFFVLPTLAVEGFGLITLEAMACGTPVIATPVGANPELITQVDSALLSQSPSPADLARAILEAWQWQDRHHAWQRKSRKLAGAYTWDSVVARLEPIYASVAAHANRRTS